MSSVFVGRQNELAVMARSLEVATSQCPAVVLVAGPPGQGKSDLLRQFAETTGEVVVVHASGDEAETGIPFGVCDQLLTGLDRGHQRPSREHAEQPRPEVTGGAGLLEVGEALLERLRSVVAASVLLIDDAHLSDRQSLAALTFALRRLQTEPVLTVVATRTDQAGGLPPGLLKLADSTGGRIGLSGLTTAEVRELVEKCGFGRVPDRVAERLRVHTGGTPLYLRALVDDARESGANWLDGALPAPRSFASLVARRLARLSPEARHLAAAAAVLGVHAHLGDAASVSQLADPLPAIEELQRAGLTEAVRDQRGWSIAFTHNLVGVSVYECLGLAARAALHRRASQVTGGAESLTHRAAATLGPDPQLAAAFEAQAAADISKGLWRVAADWLLEAARLTPSGVARDAVLIRAVESLLLAGDLAAVESYRDHVVAMPRSTQQLQVLAQVAWLAGHFGEAERLATEAWSSAEELGALGRDRLAAMLSQMCVMQGKNGEAIRWAEKALTSGVLDPLNRASTWSTWAVAVALEGRPGEALNTLPAHGNHEDAGHRELIGVRGILQLWTDDLSTAVENFRVRLRPNVLRGSSMPTPVEVLTASGPDGIEPNKLIILGFLAEAEYRRGHWDVAASLADHTVALVEDTEQYWIAAFAHSVAALVPAGRGEWKSAAYHLLSARRAASQFGDELSRAYAESAAIHVASCQGDAGGVITSAEWLLRQARPYHQEPGIHTWPTAYVGALLTLGRFAEADEAINRWEVQAQARGRRSRLAALARLRGELAARRRDTRAAREAFAVAREIGEGVSDALERSLLLTSRGAFLRRRGERRAAAAELLAAEQMLLEVGAEPFLSGVRAELKVCGLAAAPLAGGASVPLLTPQEMAVARLVVAGHNNQEIASRLFLSPKTVAYHLGHVYAKLGVNSRSRLAAAGLTALSASRAPAAGR